jgi:excisionase family DNA binding protein
VRKRKDDEPDHVEYLTPSQAARLLHVSPKTVDRWADQGLVPCVVTLGGHRRFSPEAIAAIVDQMAGKGGGGSSKEN